MLQLTLQTQRSIAQRMTQTLGVPFEIHHSQPISGGDINSAYKLSGPISDLPHTYFLKINHADRIAMFEAEAEALRQISYTHTIRVPTPICTGTTDVISYLVLEFLDLGPSVPAREFGRQLARLHRVGSQVSGSLRFGWTQDNTIGLTLQLNPWTDDWAEFWQVHRIGVQLDLAKQKGAYFKQGDRLLAAIPKLLGDHHPTPSLVHGDLWGGNAGTTRSGEPVIFDPALYWGDREVDLAMTELFGGFSPEFYAGYTEVYPIAPDYPSRKNLYNLYHILNHFNLFGGSYAGQADRMIDRLL